MKSGPSDSLLWKTDLAVTPMAGGTVGVRPAEVVGLGPLALAEVVPQPVLGADAIGQASASFPALPCGPEAGTRVSDKRLQTQGRLEQGKAP